LAHPVYATKTRSPDSANQTMQTVGGFALSHGWCCRDRQHESGMHHSRTRQLRRVPCSYSHSCVSATDPHSPPRSCVHHHLLISCQNNNHLKDHLYQDQCGLSLPISSIRTGASTVRNINPAL